MFWLIAYDINVETKAGRSRANKVRKLCNEHGDRIQKSIYYFFSGCNEMQVLDSKIKALLDVMTDKSILLRLNTGRANQLALHYFTDVGRFVI